MKALWVLTISTEGLRNHCSKLWTDCKNSCFDNLDILPFLPASLLQSGSELNVVPFDIQLQ